MEAHLVRQPFGDVSFLGWGPGAGGAEDLIPVGIEVKTLGDVLNCISDGRFAGHQLPGLIKNYSVIYLIVQAELRMDQHGILCAPRRGGLKPVYKGSRAFMWRDLQSWFFTMEMLGGVKVRICRTKREVGMTCLALYRWWTNKTWEEHHAHMAFDNSHQRPLLGDHNLVTRCAKELGGIGWTRAEEVGKTFKSVKEMVGAGVDEWESIEGIGKKIAKTAVRDLRGTNEDISR